MLRKYFEVQDLHWSRTSKLDYLNLRHDQVGDSILVGKDGSPLVLLVVVFLRPLIESYPRVKDTFVISKEDLLSDDIKSLDNMRDFLKQHFLEKCIFAVNSENFELYGPLDLAKKVTDLGKKGSQVNRYKGLGEMNPVQLWETTLDPNARYLLQVKVENEGDAEETFSTLMGETVEYGRVFIQENALKVSNLDVEGI